MDALRTPLCDLLGIDYPILQSGMGRVEQQNPEYFPMWSGQSVGLIRDLPGAAEVVETMVGEARAALRALNERVRLG